MCPRFSTSFHCVSGFSTCLMQINSHACDQAYAWRIVSFSEVRFCWSVKARASNLFIYLFIFEDSELKKAIADIPQNTPNESEELIRKLYGQILNLKKEEVKEQLLHDLKAVASRGLQEELKKLIQRQGLQREAIHLVVNFLTNIPELAEYLNETSSKPEVLRDAGLEMINKRLGPYLEVVGGLRAKGIDVSKGWVKTLCERAPSFQELTRLSLQDLEKCCQGANEGEIYEIHRLAEKAESQKNRLAAIPQDEKLIKENKNAKALDKEKLEKAKKLLNEAKVMGTHVFQSSERVVDRKVREIVNTLELPVDWFRPDEVISYIQLFEQLDQIIAEYQNVVESADSYKSEVEIVTRASSGKALCAIYHSEYKPPKPAGRPLLLVPTNVNLTNPSSAQEINYLKFSAKGTAAEYVRTVESSSTNIGMGVAGFYGLFDGKVQRGHRNERSSQADKSAKLSTTSASVLQYIHTAKKTFQLERDQINISFPARKAAKMITQDAKGNASKREKSARIFMDRYGSHFPAGVQTLGGVFFSIADAESKSAMDTYELTEAAVNHLNAQMSFGFLGGAFGIGASGTGERTSGTGKTHAKHKTGHNEIFTFSVKSMGPLATNPSTFHKLLLHNSTWALIDRGSFEGYIPVWELIRDLGKEFEEAAVVLEETWRKDENARKKEWEDLQREKKAEEELKRIKEEHLKWVSQAQLIVNFVMVIPPSLVPQISLQLYPQCRDSGLAGLEIFHVIALSRPARQSVYFERIKSPAKFTFLFQAIHGTTIEYKFSKKV